MPRFEAVDMEAVKKSVQTGPDARASLEVGLVEKAGDRVTVRCGACQGTGADRHTRGHCRACGGKGLVTIREPALRCAYCRGSGWQPHKERLGCSICGGKGVVTVKEPFVQCAFCQGQGMAVSTKLPCYACQGKGVVAVKEPLATCPSCQGTGKSNDARLPCHACKGKGVVTI